jgi:hypothetical protein
VVGRQVELPQVGQARERFARQRPAQHVLAAAQHLGGARKGGRLTRFGEAWLPRRR